MAVLDLEMTGLDTEKDRICEVAVVRGEGERVVAEYQSLVRPTVPMSPGARKVHGISDEMLADAPPFAEVASGVADLLSGAVVICHNVPFDLGFLQRELEEVGVAFPQPVCVDTLLVARRLFAFRRNNLATVCERLGVTLDGAHRALADARATHAAWRRMIEILDPDGTVTVGELLELVSALAPNSPLRLRQQRVLRDAWRHKRTVWIAYRSVDARELRALKREIAIWLLKLPYIQGWCHLRRGERVFRLDRIQSVEPGERAYEVPDFDPRI